MLNIAHRGARSLAPENTLAAARKAHALGADLWETDLAVTADGVFILFHDDALTRTTDVAEVFPDRAPGPFTDYTLEDIRRLDAGSWFAAKDPHGAIAAGEVGEGELAAFKGEKVPTLAEALTLTQDLGWRMNLELKDLPKNKHDFPVVDRLLALVRELEIGPETVLFSSARHDWLDEIRARAPEYALEALMGLLPEHAMDYGDYRFNTYNIRRTRTDQTEVEDLLKRGKGVNLYVVNAPKDIARWRAVGVSGLITDFPQRIT